jgi:hypothetical protein
MKAALTAALSDDTLKWLNRQGFEPDELRKAEFIIQKIEEHIHGTTNPYVQVVDLIGRKKSSNESFDHFVTDVCKRVKGCALDKVTNETDWFTTMIVVTNHDNVAVRKKLHLETDLKLDTAKAICKEEEKAAKHLACLEHHVSAFQPEILPKLGLSNKDMKKAPRTPKSADGSALQTLGLVEVRISKSGRTTEFLTAYVIKNLQQPILSRQVLRELGIIPQEFPFLQLSIGNRANFGSESIEQLEEALRQARAKRGIHVSTASTTSKIELGYGPELDKIANEFPEVFDNTKIPTMNGGFYKIEWEETAILFNKGSSRTVPEPCMEKLKTELELQLGLGLIEQVPAGKKSK